MLWAPGASEEKMGVPEYRVLFTVDVEDYSSRTDAEQRTLQAALGRILTTPPTWPG